MVVVVVGVVVVVAGMVVSLAVVDELLWTRQRRVSTRTRAGFDAMVAK